MRAEGRPWHYVDERKLARRKAFYETLLGKEAFSSPEELPTSLFLPAQALGDIQQAIQQTYEKGREYSQFIRWEPQRGFTPSRLYKGHEHQASTWGELPYKWHDHAFSPELVALHYHTHPDWPYEYLWGSNRSHNRFNHFSSADIAHALYHNTPIHLVVTHKGIYGLVQTEMVARSAFQREVIKKFTTDPPHSYAYDTSAGYTRGLHDIGFGLYQWQIPHDHMPFSNSSSVNWERFFMTKESQARDMRTHGITMTKLVPQTLAASSPTPETRVFGQL